MPDKPKTFNSIVVAAHPQVKEGYQEAIKIAAFLKEHGFSTHHGSLSDEDLRRRVKEGEFDLFISLGGDGTMLRAGHLCGPLGIPVLGINLGRFGFLMEIRQDQWQEVLPQLLEGNYWFEKRMMLRADQWRTGERLGSWDVLNEIVVSRGHIVRPVHLTAQVDGRLPDHLCRRWADRSHCDRLNSLCPGCRRANPAARAAQYPPGCGRAASIGRSGDRLAGRRFGEYHCAHRSPGCALSRWSGARSAWLMATGWRSLPANTPSSSCAFKTLDIFTVTLPPI